MKKLILPLAAAMPLVLAGLARPSFAVEQKNIDFTPNRPMTIERHDYQGEALKKQQASDIRNAVKNNANATQPQSLHEMIQQQQTWEMPAPGQPSTGNAPSGDAAAPEPKRSDAGTASAPQRPDAGKAHAKPAN